MIKRFFFLLWNKKRWTLWALFFLILIAYFFWKQWFQAAESTDFTSVDHVVESGSISNSLTLAGTTKFANAQKLTFVEKGKVIAVNVKVGDQVKKGQILASISTDTLDQSIEKAKRGLKTAQRNLERKLKNSDHDLDLLLAQTNYDKSKLEFDLLPQKQLVDMEREVLSVQQAEQAVKDSEKALKDLQDEYDDWYGTWKKSTNPDLSLSDSSLTRKQTIEWVIRGFYTLAIELESKLREYDQQFLIDVYQANDATGKGICVAIEDSIYLGAKNLNLRLNSNQKYWDMKKNLAHLTELYSQYSVKNPLNVDEGRLLNDYQIIKSLGSEFKSWGELNRSMIQESIETESLNKTVIYNCVDIFGTKYEEYGHSLITKYTDILNQLKKIGVDKTGSDKESRILAIEKAKTTLQSQKLAFELAKQSLSKKQIEQEIERKQKESELKKIKSSLDDLLDGFVLSDELQALKDAVDSAQEDLATQIKKYEDYRIIANFDGLVTKVDMQVWDSISAGGASSQTEKYIYVETPDLLQVSLDVDQVDIVKISIGMPVSVVLDALPDAVFSGVISEIDTMTESSSYKAKVVFQKKSEQQKVLGGMSASVKVILEQVDDAIIVPSPAIADNDAGQKIVKLQKEGKWIDQIVEIGLSDDANTQILSGLSIGDVIKGLYINDISMQNIGVWTESDDWRSVRG